jgi:hypothetical protein
MTSMWKSQWSDRFERAEGAPLPQARSAQDVVEGFGFEDAFGPAVQLCD